MSDVSKLRWRMPDEGEPTDRGDDCAEHISALARAFGHYPITLGPEREQELRAMAATWATMENNSEERLSCLWKRRCRARGVEGTAK